MKAAYILFIPIFLSFGFLAWCQNELNSEIIVNTWINEDIISEETTKDNTTICLAEIENQIFTISQFAEVKAIYDEVLNTQNNEDGEQFLGYYFSLKNVNDTDYDIALVENYPNRILNAYFFKVNKVSWEISSYDVIMDNYDSLPIDDSYSDFFSENCQNLTK